MKRVITYGTFDVLAWRYVYLVIPEYNWGQKIDDIQKYQADIWELKRQVRFS